MIREELKEELNLKSANKFPQLKEDVNVSCDLDYFRDRMFESFGKIIRWPKICKFK